MCISTSVNLGPRKALVASLGSTTAIVGIMALSALGLGTALAASESLFTVLKWLGAAYLAYLGIESLYPATDIAVSGGVGASTSRRVYAQGFLIGASNPKALLFFGALFPQFIVPSAPQVPQFLVLGATFIFFELLWLTVYALSAARADVAPATPQGHAVQSGHRRRLPRRCRFAREQQTRHGLTLRWLRKESS